MDRAKQTQRIIRAVSNPYTTILGHMTGRQLLRRPGYDIDIERVLAACAEHGVAVSMQIRGGLTLIGAGTRRRSTLVA
jgi:DNA polymerase (family X)